MDSRSEELSVRKGSYRGDVSALCLVPGQNRRRLLLAGTGPHVLLFDLTAKGKKLLQSLRVFDGVRVHGMNSEPAAHTGGDRGKSRKLENEWEAVTVVVHGERRVKLLNLSGDGNVPQLGISSALPRCNHWVVDVKHLSGGAGTDSETLGLVAVGLSNNSVLVWDLGSSAFIYRLECSERCLLYSMRLWGDSLEALRVAAGTVFNEVLVWRPVRSPLGERHASNSLKIVTGNDNFVACEQARDGGCDCQETSVCLRCRCSKQTSVVEEIVAPLQRLLGHEGSVYRLMWSSDGLSLISASDDRTARIWCAKWSGNDGDWEIDPWSKGVDSGPVLRGHGSRLWDCYLGQRFLATASEDCTCRVWTADGRCLATLKGHKGRGVWRCVHDPDFNILVTGGADSSIKVHLLDKWITPERNHVRENIPRSLSQSNSSQYGLQAFSITPPWVGVGKGQPSGFIDSKSEYVRCLALRDAWCLYVCTNQGAVYCVSLSRQAQAPWRLIADGLERPIVCMDVMPLQPMRGGDFHSGCNVADDIVVAGDGGGVVSVMHVQRKHSGQCHCLWRCSWSAESNRQLLGLHLLRAGEGVNVFTTDPGGSWRLWQVLDYPIRYGAKIASRSCTSGNLVVEDHRIGEKDRARLVAYGSEGNARILCIDMCPKAKVLVCGDKRGDIAVFSVPEDLILDKMASAELWSFAQSRFPLQLPVIAVFKGAHGISPVNSVRVLPSNHRQGVEIVSTGSDSCICTFVLDRQVKTESPQTSCRIYCSGVRKVAPSVVENLEYGWDFGNTDRQVASGFISSDFILWDVTAQSETMRVKCGGWKRPHSTLVGEFPELQQCFAFVKDHGVHVHRNWVPSGYPVEEWCSPSRQHEMTLELSTAQLKDQSLRSQFHGKEISSVVFLRTSRSDVVHEEPSSRIWMATGSEDETVIISRYAEGTNADVEPVCTLGDHVGGSAIRALALVAEPYLVNTDQLVNTIAESPERKDLSHGHDSGLPGKQELLLSAGAKEMLTCWVVDWPSDINRITPLDLGGSTGKLLAEGLNREEASGPSIQWLCSNSRQKSLASVARASGNEQADSDRGMCMNRQSSEDDHCDPSKQQNEEGLTFQRNGHTDDDQRYLCMAAFATRCAKTGATISFVVAASSNATLHLYACHVTHRSWTELAILEYPNALVLTMGFLVAPLVSGSGASCDSFMIMTGAANGEIAVWDVTEVVLQHSASGSLDVLSGGQLLRPLRGRGSQGGRLWKKKGKHEKKLLQFGQITESNHVRTPLDPSIMLQPSAGETTEFVSNCHGVEENGQSESSTGNFGSRDSFSMLETHYQRPDSKFLTVLQPLKEIKAVHQSGVNCLSIARIQSHTGVADMTMKYAVISGGDDQSLHLSIFSIVREISSGPRKNLDEGLPDVKKDHMLHTEGAKVSTEFHVLGKYSLLSAHSSAVKGVWTDGAWALSVGLDQRLRIWRLNLACVYTGNEQIQSNAKGESELVRNVPPLLEERGTFVVDVPEPASLHANVGPAGQFRIAVVGRGLQMISFDSSL